MKRLAILGAAICMALTACQRAVPSVPVSNRQVVPPKGSTEVMKSWNIPTQREGDAILGPLSNTRR